MPSVGWCIPFFFSFFFMCVYNFTTPSWHLSQAPKEKHFKERSAYSTFKVWNHRAAKQRAMGSKSKGISPKILSVWFHQTSVRSHLKTAFSPNGWARTNKPPLLKYQLGFRKSISSQHAIDLTGQQLSESCENTGGAWITCQEIKPQLVRGMWSQSKANQYSTRAHTVPVIGFYTIVLWATSSHFFFSFFFLLYYGCFFKYLCFFNSFLRKYFQNFNWHL